MSRTAIVLAALAAGVLAVRPAAAQNIVQNGDFATGDFTGWTLGGDSAGDYVSGSPGSFVAALTTSAASGTLSQILSTKAGDLYNVSFNLAGDGATPNSLVVTFGGQILSSMTDIPDTLAANPSFSFLAPATSSDTTLTFTYRDDPGYLYVTNVSAIDNSLVAPEPSQYAGLGLGALGLVGLGFKARKRRSVTEAG